LCGNGEDCMIGSFMIWMSNKYYSGDQMKKNVMAGAWGTLGERKDAHRVWGGGIWRKETSWKT
jgi:hypothetical protein